MAGENERITFELTIITNIKNNDLDDDDDDDDDDGDEYLYIEAPQNHMSVLQGGGHAKN